MKKYILLLATLSGTCGIAYEILYSRMLSTYMGDMFYVAAATLTAFLLSLGIGSLIAQKWPRSLGFIEIAIGIYAILASYVFLEHGESLVSSLVNTAVPTSIALMVSVFAILIIPAMMIGFSVPLFTLYAHKHSSKKDKDSRFGWVYFGYNIGAALCVISIEYILLRALGIAQSTQLIACINIIIGVMILKIPAPKKPAKLSLKISIDNKIAALFIASFASGILQLFYLKITNKVFGPFHENFAIILTSALLGIALGSAIITISKLKFHHAVLIAGIFVAGIFALLSDGIYTWAELNTLYAAPKGVSWILKILLVLALTLPPFIFIGATIPALLKDKSTKLSTGHALAVSSFGNCAGFLLMLFFLHQYLPDAGIALLIAVTLLFSACLFAYKQKLTVAFAAAVMVICAIYLPPLWPTKLLQIDYHKFADINYLQRTVNDIKDSKTYKGMDSTVDLIRTKRNETLYIINGYQSLAIGGFNKANLRELVFGMAPALFSENHDSTLVLGLGTGLTSAGTASVFKHVDVAEISPLVIDMIDVFEEENLHLSKKKHVNIKLQDGLIALMEQEKKYDAIINTVTSPIYFSSAKLYTANFFKLAAKKLNKNGVYTIWFDSRISDHGVKIIFNSLKHAFQHCETLHLTNSYHQIICSNDELRMHRNTRWSQEMQDYFQNHLHIHLPLQTFIENLVVHSHPRFKSRGITETKWNAPLNTFNNPELEFDISKRLFSHDLWKSRKRVTYEDLDISSYDGHKLSPLEMAHRCAAFATIAMRGDTACLSEALKQPGIIDIDEYLYLTIGHFILNGTYPQAFTDVYNILIANVEDLDLPSKVLPFMCAKNISTIQRSVFQYFYLGYLLDNKKNVPKKLLSQMLTTDAYPEAYILAKNTASMFLVPGMQRKLDIDGDPCDK